MSYVESTVDQLIVLERQVESRAEAVSGAGEKEPRAAALVEAIRKTTRDQRAALEGQRERVTGADEGSLRLALSLPALYGSLSEAVFGYAVLHAAAHRAFDSQADGN